VQTKPKRLRGKRLFRFSPKKHHAAKNGTAGREGQADTANTHTNKPYFLRCVFETVPQSARISRAGNGERDDAMKAAKIFLNCYKDSIQRELLFFGSALVRSDSRSVMQLSGHLEKEPGVKQAVAMVMEAGRVLFSSSSCR
jgi:hypothetical protein